MVDLSRMGAAQEQGVAGVTPVRPNVAAALGGFVEQGIQLFKRNDAAAGDAVVASQLNLELGDRLNELNQQFAETPTTAAVQDANAAGLTVTPEQEGELGDIAEITVRAKQVAKQNPNRRAMAEIRLIRSRMEFNARHPQLINALEKVAPTNASLLANVDETLDHDRLEREKNVEAAANTIRTRHPNLVARWGATSNDEILVNYQVSGQMDLDAQDDSYVRGLAAIKAKDEYEGAAGSVALSPEDKLTRDEFVANGAGVFLRRANSVLSQIAQGPGTEAEKTVRLQSAAVALNAEFKKAVPASYAATQYDNVVGKPIIDLGDRYAANFDSATAARVTGNQVAVANNTFKAPLELQVAVADLTFQKQFQANMEIAGLNPKAMSFAADINRGIPDTILWGRDLAGKDYVADVMTSMFSGRNGIRNATLFRNTTTPAAVSQKLDLTTKGLIAAANNPVKRKDDNTIVGFQAMDIVASDKVVVNTATGQLRDATSEELVAGAVRVFAQPGFKEAAREPEFQNQWKNDPQMAERFSAYAAGFTETFARQAATLHGKGAWDVDEKGLLTFRPTAAISTAERRQASQLVTKLNELSMALTHIEDPEAPDYSRSTRFLGGLVDSRYGKR